MATIRSALYLHRLALRPCRTLTTTARLRTGERQHPNVDEHRQAQKEKPLTPHMTNSTSTISNEMPSVGADKPPPEFLTSVDPDFVPKDSIPENTQRMTGNSQPGQPDQGPNADLGVGEIQGAKFKVEPLRRSGEDANTLRVRLLYQSRKRGTLESDLLLSTFADAQLDRMNQAQLNEYDRFLDENDWDIYYWATQEPSPTSTETAEGASTSMASASAKGHDPYPASASLDSSVHSSQAPNASSSNSPTESSDAQQEPFSGEWAQTIGRFKPAYRPVPARWQDSSILAMLREHVLERSAPGVEPNRTRNSQSKNSYSPDARNSRGGSGLGGMPEVRSFAR